MHGRRSDPARYVRWEKGLSHAISRETQREPAPLHTAYCGSTPQTRMPLMYAVTVGEGLYTKLGSEMNE